MAYLRQVFFRQTGHFHDGTAVNTAAEHGTGNFELAFIAAFFDTTLFTELNPLLDALLFKLLSDGQAQKKGDFSVALIINFLTPPSAS